MAERSLAIRFTVRDADKARAEMDKLGTTSKQATQSIEKGARAAGKGVNQLARANRRAGEATTEAAEASRAAERALEANTKAAEENARKARVLDQSIERLGEQWKEGQIDAEQFRRSVRSLEGVYGETTQSARLLGREQSRLRTGLTRTADAARRLTSRLGGVGGIATAVAGGGVAALATSSIRAASELDEMSRAAGVNVETLQRLQAAGEDFKVSGEAIADGLRELQVRADEFAKTGKGEAVEAFNRLNLEQRDVAENLDNNERLFRRVIQRVSELDDRASQVRVLDEIFGEEAGRQLLGFLEASEGEIKRIGDEAERAGRVLSKDTTEAATKLQNEFQDVADAVQKAFAKGTVEAFNGEIGNLSKQVTDAEFQQGIVDIGENLGQITKQARGFLEVANQLANSDFASFIRENVGLQRLLPDFTELAEGNLSSLRNLLVNPNLVEGAKDLAGGLTGIADAGDEAATKLKPITVTAESLPKLFTESGEAGLLLAKGLGETGESAGLAADKMAAMAEQAGQAKPPLDKLTKSSIDLSQSLELAALKAKAFRDQGDIEAGTGRIAREMDDTSQSARDVADSVDRAASETVQFEDEATQSAAAVEGFGEDFGRALR